MSKRRGSWQLVIGESDFRIILGHHVAEATNNKKQHAGKKKLRY